MMKTGPPIQMIKYLMIACLLLASIPRAHAGIEQTFYDDGIYRIHYSVFNSRFLTKNTASALGITRSPSQAIVTIAVTRKNKNTHDKSENYSLGIPAEVTGKARNLMQQDYDLEFQAVNENDVRYYIATLDYINEEVFHFDITVKTIDGAQTQAIAFTFNRKLHTEK